MQAQQCHDRIVTKPILPVNDMEKAHAFYRQAGFTVESYGDGFAAVLHQGRELILLDLVASINAQNNPAAAYLHVVSADAWHTRLHNAGLGVSEILDQDFGMREFHLRDPSGNLLRIGQNLETNETPHI